MNEIISDNLQVCCSGVYRPGRVRDKKRNTKEGVLQLVGRGTETGALVRYNAQPPDWSASDGPAESSHWLRHQPMDRLTERQAAGP